MHVDAAALEIPKYGSGDLYKKRDGIVKDLGREKEREKDRDGVDLEFRPSLTKPHCHASTPMAM